MVGSKMHSEWGRNGNVDGKAIWKEQEGDEGRQQRMNRNGFGDSLRASRQLFDRKVKILLQRHLWCSVDRQG